MDIDRSCYITVDEKDDGDDDDALVRIIFLLQHQIRLQRGEEEESPSLSSRNKKKFWRREKLIPKDAEEVVAPSDQVTFWTRVWLTAARASLDSKYWLLSIRDDDEEDDDEENAVIIGGDERRKWSGGWCREMRGEEKRWRWGC